MASESHYENGTLTMTRTYDAPAAAVFNAWVEASKVQQWWGCSQTTNVVSEIEPEVGGKYCHAMTIEGAGEYPLTCRITEFEPPKVLAYEEVASDIHVRVTFTEGDGRTEVKLVQSNLPDNIGPIVKGGWGVALEKLDGFLSRELTGA